MRKIITVMAGVALSASAVAAGAPRVDLTLQHVPMDGRPNNLRVVATNHGSGDAYVLTYHSVFAQPEGRTTGRWIVLTDESGAEVRYTGRSVLIRSPGPMSYMRIPPDASITADVDLGREYALSEGSVVSARAMLDVLERVPMLDRDGEPEDVPHEMVDSQAVTFRVVASGRRTSDGTSSVIQCTADQLAATGLAIAGAQAASSEASMFLSSLYYTDPIDPANPVPPRVHMKPSLRYQYWFGTWDESAPQLPDPEALHTDNAKVDQVMVATYARLLSGARTVCDSCPGYDPSSRAWNEGDLIHLCPVNFLDPVTGGITSQAGTIAHEVTHKVDTYAEPTVDFPGVNNRATAHALGRHSAVRSGANYEYFIMDVPLGRDAAGKKD